MDRPHGRTATVGAARYLHRGRGTGLSAQIEEQEQNRTVHPCKSVFFLLANRMLLICLAYLSTWTDLSKLFTENVIWRGSSSLVLILNNDSSAFRPVKLLLILAKVNWNELIECRIIVT